MYTPDPLRRSGSEPLTHYWVAEFQAVPWLGAVDSEGRSLTMADRAGLPLGRYRFHVVGKSFDIASNPFQVQAASLGVSAARSGNTITVGVAVGAPSGYRLLDMDSPSNASSVPIREGTFVVTISKTTGPDVEMSLPIDSSGQIAIDLGADAADVTSIRVEDPHGNTGSATL
jgi:hypothetical protein